MSEETTQPMSDEPQNEIVAELRRMNWRIEELAAQHEKNFKLVADQIGRMTDQFVSNSRRVDHKFDEVVSNMLELRADIRELYQEMREIKGGINATS